MRLITIIGLLLAVSAAGKATAQMASPPPAAPATPAAPGAPGAGAGRGEAMARLQAADADKDGKWSKAEWIAAGRRDRGFDFLDADSDGFMTVAELQFGMQKLRASHGGQ